MNLTQLIQQETRSKKLHKPQVGETFPLDIREQGSGTQAVIGMNLKHLCEGTLSKGNPLTVRIQLGETEIDAQVTDVLGVHFHNVTPDQLQEACDSEGVTTVTLVSVE